MLSTDRNFIKNTKIKYIKKIKPSFFLPYASFFEERLERDKLYIDYNIKNTTKVYEKICKELKIKILDVNKRIFLNLPKKIVQKNISVNILKI